LLEYVLKSSAFSDCFQNHQTGELPKNTVFGMFNVVYCIAWESSTGTFASYDLEETFNLKKSGDLW